MSRGAQLRVSRTRSIPKPNEYIEALYGEFAGYCFDEEAAPRFKGRWREMAFQAPFTQAMDLEIGTGNGFHFAHYAKTQSERLFVGLELKYKPLIQSIRRALRADARNGRMVRYNASLLDQLFAPEEVNDVFIHFPDPWSKLRQQKHRLLQIEFLRKLWTVQKPGASVEFKTDNRDYFDWAMERIAESPYRIEFSTTDLHRSEWAAKNFVTQFESLFIRDGQPICMASLRKSGL